MGSSETDTKQSPAYVRYTRLDTCSIYSCDNKVVRREGLTELPGFPEFALCDKCANEVLVTDAVVGYCLTCHRAYALELTSALTEIFTLRESIAGRIIQVTKCPSCCPVIELERYQKKKK